MKQHNDTAIVLSRIDYGERDRILTLLCRENGKISVLAKSVRSAKSRLAGGIELLSVSEISFIDGKSNLKALTGARLKKHFGKITQDMTRMQLSFEYLRAINGITEDKTGQEFFGPLAAALEELDKPSQDHRIVDIWFSLKVLSISGSEPNLRVDTDVENNDKFHFDYDLQQFIGSSSGQYTQNDLKLLRLCSVQQKPPRLEKPTGSEDRLQALLKTLLRANVTEV
jgi:DNA repair protein RecO (recombination protein O)